ncbi:SDR family oxidoreductase [Pectinatus frisingensis]|uniref:SDR family oxidoreductase n=1 Tax=Pectinatus frisingensis TaxID=865 RepID=UPI0018C4B332|nr:SDR family oxidoreductase [Pectinatus frisingensis]
MRIFVTGATGYIGSAVVQELIQSGHKVIGLTRSEGGAKKLEQVGAEALIGTLEDTECLCKGASMAEGVIHMAFRHDFSDFAGSLTIDLNVINTIGETLRASGKPFMTTAHAYGEASDKATLSLAARGVRSAVISLAPSVHSNADSHGFIPQLIGIARSKGVSAYVGDGANRWPAIHRLDAAKLFRLAFEKAPAGSCFTGRGEEGIPFRKIASTIGKHLNIPVVSISREEANAHFGFLGTLSALDIPSVIPGNSAQTREILGWDPVQPGLIADLEQGHYFKK